MRIGVKFPTVFDHLIKALHSLQSRVNFDNSKPAKGELVSNLCFEVMKTRQMPESENKGKNCATHYHKIETTEANLRTTVR